MAGRMNCENEHMLDLDLYIYDYLRKKNLHQCAEAFREEADLTIDPTVPIEIDVPDGFLYEWWLLVYNLFFVGQGKTHQQGPSMMVKEMMKNRTQSKASLLQECEVNEQTRGNLFIAADYGITTATNLLPLTGWPIAGIKQTTRGLPSFQQQQELVSCTPGKLHQPGSFDDLVCQEVGSSIHAASGVANVSQNEKSGNGKELFNSGNEISGKRGVSEASSDASAFMEKYWDGGEPSNDNED